MKRLEIIFFYLIAACASFFSSFFFFLPYLLHVQAQNIPDQAGTRGSDRGTNSSNSLTGNSSYFWSRYQMNFTKNIYHSDG